jgi:hypothetical protein
MPQLNAANNNTSGQGSERIIKQEEEELHIAWASRRTSGFY